MIIELPREIENELEATARARGISVGQYVERLVAQTSQRHTQIAAFRSAIAERVASLDAGEGEDGETVMDCLISDLPLR